MVRTNPNAIGVFFNFLDNVTRRRARLFIYLQYLLDGAGFAIGYARQRLLHYRGDGRKGDLAGEKSFHGNFVGCVQRAGRRSARPECLIGQPQRRKFLKVGRRESPVARFGPIQTRNGRRIAGRDK